MFFLLTEHGHVLPGVQGPVAPVGPVSMQGGVLLMVIRRLCPEGVDDPDVTSAHTKKGQIELHKNI